MTRRRRAPHSPQGRPGARPVVAAHAFVGCALTLAVAGAVAHLSGSIWVFPSLGPTAMLQIERPMAPDSTPRNTFIGHLVAIAAGYLALVAARLTNDPGVLITGVSWPRAGAAAGSLAVTALALLILDASHPPAGATTLIVSLGLLHTPRQLLVVGGGVVLVTAVGWLYNRATGQPMPLWRLPEPASPQT